MTDARKPIPASDRPFAVVIRGLRGRERSEWNRYTDFIEADDQARALRRHGFDAGIEIDPASAEASRGMLLDTVMQIVRPFVDRDESVITGEALRRLRALGRGDAVNDLLVRLLAVDESFRVLH